MRIRYIFLYLNILLCSLQTSCAPVIIVVTGYSNTPHNMPANNQTVIVAIEPMPAAESTLIANSTEPAALPVVVGKNATIAETKSTANADYRSIPSLRHHLPLTIPETADLDESQRHDVECIAWNLYFEARGGSLTEQVAIAYVPINRIGRRDFGNNICANVFQYGIHNGVAKHQFSWAGIRLPPNWRREDDAWIKMQSIAVNVYRHNLADPSRGAVFFHSVHIENSWAQKSRKIVLGHHLFWSQS